MGVLPISQIDVETRLAVDWRETYRSRLVSAEQALKSVRSKDRVVIPIGCNPQLLGDTLAARMDELENVEVAHTATGWPYLWLQSGLEGPFKVVHEHWASPLGWEGMRGRRHDFLPAPFSLRFKGAEANRTLQEARTPDVVLVQVTPPDEGGMINLGPHVWNQREYIARGSVHSWRRSATASPDATETPSSPWSAFSHFVEYDSPSLAARHIQTWPGSPGPLLGTWRNW